MTPNDNVIQANFLANRFSKDLGLAMEVSSRLKLDFEQGYLLTLTYAEMLKEVKKGRTRDEVINEIITKGPIQIPERERERMRIQLAGFFITIDDVLAERQAAAYGATTQ